MTVLVLAAEGGSITPGAHSTVEFLGLTFNIDTIIGTLVAGVIVCGLGLYMARGATKGKPSGLQVAFEALASWVQGQVKEGMGLRAPRGVVGLCITLFAFILTCNWLAALPSEHYVPPPTSDVNLVYPLALLVIIWVNVAGIRRRGAKAYFGHFTKPYAFLAPIEFITQYFARPLSLALRLFGNIFAGGIMVAVIGLMPVYILWAPNAVWKLFDMFIGVIQALIFTLLTLIYFSEAVGSEEEAAH
ncbi:MAG: F-type H+-transporting ATPase subunit a [Pseudonocardiales bacterium]|jgi:F-type H+-transporting ATPase subunit a|uniref:F0F1 ATP synthase subunit A n=1 Tax=Pseudonocardia sp. TaxID=60912 RepID=UPI002623F055|nr:F0F1 ATP synthase subunit A [Pseudonocardia sp.]MCW2721819.1 synthase subunit a [Pseudonocardia sp.]MDT7613972.1 F-type H+-transporting ATPase subunit a [Pseudonocardiales bacterium]MDT7706774.1 F-type H+-transporting ATPase subunit a [Pseudonocardiales bacterium]